MPWLSFSWFQFQIPCRIKSTLPSTAMRCMSSALACTARNSPCFFVAARTRRSVSALMLGQSLRSPKPSSSAIFTQIAPLAAMRSTTASGVCSAGLAPAGSGCSARIRGFENVVVEYLVANGLVDEHEWIAIDDRRHAATVCVRVLRLRREHRDTLGAVGGVEYLRHAEVEVAAWLLREEVLLQRKNIGVLRPERQAGRVGHVHVRIRQPGREEFAGAIQAAHASGRGDGPIADGGDATVADQHVAIAERLRLFRRQQRDVLDEQRTSGR